MRAAVEEPVAVSYVFLKAGELSSGGRGSRVTGSRVTGRRASQLARVLIPARLRANTRCPHAGLDTLALREAQLG